MLLMDEIVKEVRIGLGKIRQNKKSELKGRPLDEQRTIMSRSFYHYLESMYSANQVSEIYDKLSGYIEEFLYCKGLPNAFSVQGRRYAPWLTDERKNQIRWDYSNRYLQYLLSIKNWSSKSVDSIDSSTDLILNHCGDPSTNAFNVKGLVVGDVQAGKTANYTSLIAKAIDAGYKVIVVLAGTTNELRSQTQKRLDLEIIGYDSNPEHIEERDEQTGDVLFGVSKIRVLRGVQSLTHSGKRGDLKRNSTTSLTADVCYLAVIKKCVSPLEALIKFLKSDPDKIGGKITLPVLLIDDEADLASVNTSGDQKITEAKATNKRIREILFKQCSRFTYVGYTATPFANVFIAPHNKDLEDGDIDDIFPSDFIITLPTPPDYCGAKEYFGVVSNTSNDNNIKTDLVTYIEQKDLDGFGRTKRVPAALQECLAIPDSLREAIKCFLIGVGIKISRNIIENCTMLINVDVSVNFNNSLKQNIASVFKEVCRGFKNFESTRKEFKKYWEEKMQPVSEKRFGEVGKPLTDHWEGDDGIEKGILTAVSSWVLDDSVKLIAGTKDSDNLDYSETEYGIYVCVGGQKLSRGLTLEGLSVSYYGRNASAIDSLMQMGRWFGYRGGWLDVCRVFTTKRIVKDYLNAAMVLANFKDQVKVLNDNPNATPEVFGLYVKAANELLPTSRQKMRGASKENLSFSGTLVQTTTFSKTDNANNLNAFSDFVKGMSNAEKLRTRAGFGSPIFKNVDCKEVLMFLEKLKYPSSSVKLWQKYINESLKVGELKKWTVILSTLQAKNANSKIDLAGFDVYKATRSLSVGGNSPSEFSIRALTRPSDYLGFFPDGITPEKRDGFDWEGDQILKKYYTPDNCVLVLYVVDLYERAEEGKPLPSNPVAGGENIAGLGIWFPLSYKMVKEDYVYLNPVALLDFQTNERAGRESLENSEGDYE